MKGPSAGSARGNRAVPDGGQALPRILAALSTEGIPVASVSVNRPSLDDVYLHYTGREFAAEDHAGDRDGDAPGAR